MVPGHHYQDISTDMSHWLMVATKEFYKELNTTSTAVRIFGTNTFTNMPNQSSTANTGKDSCEVYTSLPLSAVTY